VFKTRIIDVDELKQRLRT